MKSIARRAQSITLALSVLSSSPVSAQGPTCDEVLTECDRALESARLLIIAHEDESTALRKLLFTKNETISDLRVWYRQPQYIVPASLLIGIVGGLYLGRR